MSFFKDYPHNITTKMIDGKKYIQRSLNDNDVLKKEITAQRYLERQGFVPRIYNIDEDFYTEEFISGTSIGQTPLDEKILKSLSKLLTRLHKTEVSDELFLLLQDEFTKDRRYKPWSIMRSITNNLPQKESGLILQKVKTFFLDTEHQLNEAPYFFSIVHGDLSGNNIIQRDDDLIIIDWSDVRVDIPSADVSQLFYLLKFTEDQRRDFLKYYEIPFVTDNLLRVHDILLRVYDFIQFYPQQEKLLPDILKKLDYIVKGDET